MWLSYIPRRSLPDWLNQCSCIMASIFSSSPRLTVQNCGLCLVYRHDEVEFKEAIRHCIASLLCLIVGVSFIIWRMIIDKEISKSPSRTGSSSEDADAERLRGSVDHRLKDKGKRVLEWFNLIWMIDDKCTVLKFSIVSRYCGIKNINGWLRCRLKQGLHFATLIEYFGTVYWHYSLCLFFVFFFIFYITDIS